MFSTAVRFLALASFMAVARGEDLTVDSNKLCSEYAWTCDRPCAACVFVGGTEGDYTVDIDTTLCKTSGVSNAFIPLDHPGSLARCWEGCPTSTPSDFESSCRAPVNDPETSTSKNQDKCNGLDGLDGFRVSGLSRSGTLVVGTKDGQYCNVGLVGASNTRPSGNSDEAENAQTCFTTIDLSQCIPGTPPTGTPPTGTPPGTGGGGGDPHFKMWNGKWFDYQGECDMVLVHAPSFAQGLGLDVHVRTKIQYDYSYISNAVLSIDGETFEVASHADFFLNGIEGVQMPNMIAGYPISYNKINDQEAVFMVDFGREEVLKFKVFKDFVTVKFEGALESDFADSVGLMGDFKSEAMTSRNGTALATEDIAVFAQEWQVRDNEPKLFVKADRYPQYPMGCVLPKADEKKTFLRFSASAN